MGWIHMLEIMILAREHVSQISCHYSPSEEGHVTSVGDDINERALWRHQNLIYNVDDSIISNLVGSDHLAARGSNDL